MTASEHEHALYKKIALFFFAYRSLNEKPDRIAEKYAIQRVHHRILFFIGHLPGLSVNELLTILEVTKQALNVPLRQLREKNYITTDSDPHDKRIKRLHLTGSGSELLQELTAVQMEQLQAIIDKVGASHIAAWTKVMEEYAEERPGSKYLDSL
ncbi:MarR family transcriptional regulator [Paenibacillus oenotherae]|uniref:MarR family transcriptional regulator n=1 Tax=Paenibacillus oenotherae TaxID=1435645 RepID=A0ABS7D9I9_9BACL|nr:MarR family transcriptional regulator [Paenibacillus oenotherae]